MQEHTHDRPASTTGGAGRAMPETDHSATPDLYAPVPGDDNATRPGMVESGDTPAMTTDRPARTGMTDTTGSTHRQREDTRTTGSTQAYRARSLSESSQGGIMQKINANPFAVVAAATAGGMLVGRMMRGRGKQRDTRMMRGMAGRPYQQYREPPFVPYQSPPRYQGYQPSGYQMPRAFQGGPQYRAEQDYAPERTFEGRHENFPGGSHWD